MTPCRLIIAGTVALGALGCQVNDLVDPGQEPVEPDEFFPDIVVSPGSLDFGEVAVGSEAEPNAVAEILTISNEGVGDLHLSAIAMSDDEVEVFELSAVTSVLINPGGSAQFVVSYTPVSPEAATGEVVISSDDPDEPELRIPVQGQGTAPVIELEPATVDFGTVFTGCDASQTIAFRNMGNADLEISELTLDTPSTRFALVGETAEGEDAPWAVAPDGSLEVELSFTSVDEGLDEATLVVQSNDPRTPAAELPLLATGAPYSAHTDSWVLPKTHEIDVVFSVDRTISPVSTYTELQEGFDALAEALDRVDADYRVAVTVEDDGCINGEQLYLDPSFDPSEASDVMTAMINLGGSLGSNPERGFMLLEAALAASEAEGCNEGLVREDALLHLVLMSDEPEQSTIVVTVDGVVVETGWTYNSTDNSIDFEDGSWPAAGATVEVSYATPGPCD